MKRSQLAEIIREQLQGYSKYIGKTQGGTSDEFMRILTAIANEDDKYEGDAEKGNAILDKANQDNVDRITRGEDPVYEGQTGTMDLQQMIDYIGGLSPETVVEVPRVYPGGFGSDIVTRTTVDKAIKQLSNVLNSEDHNKEQFTLSQDNPKFKSFSVVVSPQDLEKRTIAMSQSGPLD